jgi:hypothetical protein
MILRHDADGLYEILRHRRLAANFLGQVGTDFQVAGLGSFTGDDTTHGSRNCSRSDVLPARSPSAAHSPNARTRVSRSPALAQDKAGFSRTEGNAFVGAVHCPNEPLAQRDFRLAPQRQGR